MAEMLITIFIAVVVLLVLGLLAFQVSVFIRLLKGGKAPEAFAYFLRTRTLSPDLLPQTNARETALGAADADGDFGLL